MSEAENGFHGIDRAPRASKTREKTAQRRPWAPPSTLDAPPAPEGFKHRWIRAEVRGFDDRKNISARLREGYELVRKDEYPDFEAPVIDSGNMRVSLVWAACFSLASPSKRSNSAILTMLTGTPIS